MQGKEDLGVEKMDYRSTGLCSGRLCSDAGVVREEILFSFDSMEDREGNK